MNRALATALIWAACGGANALEIKAYNTRLDIAPNGSAKASAVVQLADCRPGRFRLPAGFATIEDFKMRDSPAGVSLTVVASKVQSAVEIEFSDDIPAEVNIAFEFQVPGALFEPRPEEGQKPAFPAGTRLFRHTFVNTQSMPISQYAVQVRLPKETLVHAIREQLPKTRRKEFTPRVELDRFDGQQGALLQISGLKQGDRTSMELEVIDEGRSFGWLLVGLVLAIGYLVSFRDLVKSERH